MRSKSETKRQTIVDVARVVFQELGFDGTSMSEITARLGGSKATLYSYFASKDDLFVEVIRQLASSVMRNVFDELDSRLDLQTCLLQFGERFLQANCRPDLINAYRNALAESRKSSVGRLFYERGPHQGLLNLARYLEECMNLGKLRRADAMVAAQHLLALLKAESAEALLLGAQEGVPARDIPPMVARAVEIFLRGYAP